MHTVAMNCLQIARLVPLHINYRSRDGIQLSTMMSFGYLNLVVGQTTLHWQPIIWHASYMPQPHGLNQTSQQYTLPSVNACLRGQRLVAPAPWWLLIKHYQGSLILNQHDCLMGVIMMGSRKGTPGSIQGLPNTPTITRQFLFFFFFF